MGCISLKEKSDWNFYSHNKVDIWFRSFFDKKVVDGLIRVVEEIISSNQQDVMPNLLDFVKKINGNFSIIICADTWLFSSVDKIRSMPLYYIGPSLKDFHIGDCASLLVQKLKLDVTEVNPDSVIQMAMSGYCIGRYTIVKNLYQLSAGECVFINESKLIRKYYYTYSPWKVKYGRKKKDLVGEFLEICWTTIQDLVKTIDDRQIVIPLSAGNDSRLIASCLKEMGVKNVLCFSYGKNGNFESETAKIIADKLGYQWVNIPVSIKSQKSFFQSDVYQQYVDKFESYASVPAVQDISEIYSLFENNIIDKEAIIINGNSGDFISGGHVLNGRNDLGLNQFLDKHYSLWTCLRTSDNDAMIISKLNEYIVERGIPKDLPEHLMFGVIESLEYAGRQTQYVINQQRAYDYFGYDWRLPLWNDNFLNFWEGVPVEYKMGQNLYLESLYKSNWGGVWRGIPVNKQTITPVWLRLIRLITKSGFAPLGRGKWHKFDKKYFQYWIEPSCNIAIASYYDVLHDKKGYRNHVSWVAENYLKKHNIQITCDQ